MKYTYPVNSTRTCPFIPQRRSYFHDHVIIRFSYFQSPLDKEKARSLVEEPVVPRRSLSRFERSHSPGAVRHYDWNSTHFYPDIIDIDTTELQTYQGQQPRTACGLRIEPRYQNINTNVGHISLLVDY